MFVLRLGRFLQFISPALISIFKNKRKCRNLISHQDNKTKIRDTKNR